MEVIYLMTYPLTNIISLKTEILLKTFTFCFFFQNASNLTEYQNLLKCKLTWLKKFQYSEPNLKWLHILQAKNFVANVKIIWWFYKVTRFMKLYSILSSQFIISGKEQIIYNLKLLMR